MWAFVDAAAGGHRLPPLAGLPELPFEADYAIQISGSDEGTLWTFSGSEWLPSEQELDFAQGGSGDTEVRLPLDLTQVDELSLVAMAIDDSGAAWSTFPTTNPLDQFVEAYHWRELSTTDPNADPSVGTTATMAVSSTQAPQGIWSAETVISYTIEVKNWERCEVAGLQISLEPSEGLTVETPILDLPALISEDSYSIEVNGLLSTDLSSLAEVTNTISLQLGGVVLDQFITHHPVDGLPPEVQINVPPDNVIGAGSKFVSGSAVDGVGSGVVSVQVWNNGTWQMASGTSFWTAEVTVPAGDNYTLNTMATDATGNTSEVSHTYVVDTDAPELSFGMPALLTGDDFVLLGTATDATSRVERVEVQLDGVGLWLPVVGPFQSDEAGTQSWLYSLDLPQEDHVEHQLRARAVDVAGNETVAEWQLTTVDNVAPDITVETTLAQVLLSD